jgi:sugar phosphate isomerase/epimerase
MGSKIDLGGSAKSPKDVKELHALGLAFAEVAITDPVSFSSLIREYRELKDQLELFYLCHGPREGDPNDTTALETKFFPKILQILPMMMQLDMRLLTLHLWLDRRFIKKEVLSFKVGLLRRIVDEAADDGITVCIENLSEEARDMGVAFSEIPTLMMTLDIGHAELLSKQNRSYGFLRECPDRVKHIHMHDNRGGHSPVDDLHLPPGKGLIDFKSIFGVLHKTGYAGMITLELKPVEIPACLPYVKNLLRPGDP